MNYKIGQYGWSIGSEKRMAGDELGKGQHLEDQVLPFVCCLFSSFQFSCSVMSDSLRPHGLQRARPPCPSPTPRVYSLMSIKSVMPSNHLSLCRPLLLLPSILLSLRVFSSESGLSIMWSSIWSFSFSISPSNEYSGLISFMIDWYDFLAVQGTLKSLLQYHSSKS